MEFAYIAPFKGPDAERGKAGQLKIQEQWIALVDVYHCFALLVD